MRDISNALMEIYERNKEFKFLAEMTEDDKKEIILLTTKYFRRMGHSPRGAERFAQQLLDEKMYSFKDFIEIVKEA